MSVRRSSSNWRKLDIVLPRRLCWLVTSLTTWAASACGDGHVSEGRQTRRSKTNHEDQGGPARITVTGFNAALAGRFPGGIAATCPKSMCANCSCSNCSCNSCLGNSESVSAATALTAGPLRPHVAGMAVLGAQAQGDFLINGQ